MIEQRSSDSHGKIIVFGAKQIRRLWHENEWWFSVIDVIGAFSDSSNANRYWSDLKRKLEQEAGSAQPYEKIVRLKLTAPDGKQRATDCAGTDTLFRIIQSIPSPKKVVSGSHAPRENQSIYIDQAAIFHLDKNLAPFDLFPHSINGDITA